MLAEGMTHCGDCLELMKQLPDKCVDLVLTDPPYNLGYNYPDYSDRMPEQAYIEMFCEFQNMPMVVIHYPEEMIKYCCYGLGNPNKCVAWIYNANTPRQWRMIAWFNCTPDLSLVKQPYKNPTDKRIMELQASGSEGTSLYDWWEIQQVKNISSEKVDYTCQIPVEVLKRIILTTTKPNDLILDPFMGGGSVGVAAIQTGRRFIGFDISPTACKLANDRCEAARRGLTLNEHRNGQQSLFEEE